MEAKSANVETARTRNWAVALSAQEDQNTRRDREHVHHGAQSREAEIEHRYERGHDEPDREQQHSKVSREFHWQTPFLTELYLTLRRAIYVRPRRGRAGACARARCA